MSGLSSNRLKQHREKIMSIWVERSLKEVPSAEAAETLALRDSLPIYLDHLSEALATNRRMDIRSVMVHDKEAIRIGKLHGADRAGNTSYVLTEVIFEYHILREVIFQVLETEGPLGPLERDIIYDSIEQAVNDAAVKFSEVHADIQQKFIDTLTHDLKTPLSAAKLTAQMILRRPENAEASQHAATKIIRCLDRLGGMIHDLLDASRVRAGELLSLEFVTCDLVEIICDVADEMSVLHGDRFVVESKEVIEGSWGRDGVRRAMENLLGNAVKYGSADTPITIFLKRAETGIEVAVHNLGNPIPSEELPVLFQHFGRSRSAHEAGKTGWGLGLTLVRGVVEAHNGKMRVESSKEKGTSFIIELPYRTR